MFIVDRFVLRPGLRRRRRAGAHRRSSHGRLPSSTRRLERARFWLPAACGIGIATLVGWTLAGGTLLAVAMPFGQPERMAETASGAPVHIDSSPAGARVRIDGASSGQTPLDVRLSPGQHQLSLQHPDVLDGEQTLQVEDSGAMVDIDLWRRQPGVMPLRPVYPGASLLNAQFLNDGQLALLVGLPFRAGSPSANREVWRLDPATDQLVRVAVPGLDPLASVLALSPGADQVAYVTPGTAAGVTAAGWSAAGSSAGTVPQTPQPESVWLAPLDGSQPPRRVFALPSARTPAASSVGPEPEHIVDLVWTPDGSRLVAITRQDGPPVRSRIFALDVPPAGETGSSSDASELVLLPAEVLPGSAVPDPGGQWLALVTHAAVAPGGSNLLNLCVLELQPGGTFRDVADLGAAATAPAAAPVAWLSVNDTGAPDKLVFVGPAPATTSGAAGLFGIFGALRPSAPPSGLFVTSPEDGQVRRLGTSVNTFGPVWRSETSLLGFAHQDDGTLALRSLDPTSGAVRDLGVRLPAGTGQGASGLAARWDPGHGSALLLGRSPGVTSGGGDGGGALQAWLVSFASPSTTDSAPH